MIIVIKRMKKIFFAFLLMFTGVLLLAKRELAAKGIIDGLSVCGTVLIPSLFPFMMLSSFAVNSGVLESRSKTVKFIFEKLLKLPTECFSAVFFGFIGGYPVGAGILAFLHDKGVINEKQAKRLMSFCVNAGPAFIVTAAGTMLLGSVTAGIVLLLSVCIASVMTGMFFSFMYKTDMAQTNGEKEHLSLSDSLVEAVAVSCEKMLIMCGWVLLFSALSGIIEPYIENETLFLIFKMVTEVTTGIEAAVRLGSIPMTAACISFGGVSVMCQIIPSLKKCGVKIHEYLAFRIVNAVLAFFAAKIIVLFVHVPIDVFAGIETHLWSYTAPSSAILLIMCAVLIFDITSGQPKKLKLGDITG